MAKTLENEIRTLTIQGKGLAAAGLLTLLGAVLAPVPVTATSVTALSTVTADGYVFTNFDLPNSGNNAASGTNINGISNNGLAVGFSIDNNGNLMNFVGNPNGTVTPLPLSSNAAMALGVNNAGDVVGQQNKQAFILPLGGSPQTLANLSGTSSAFGINDQGTIVGQYTSGASTPGFALTNNTLTTINAPSGANNVNAQGVNNKGLVVGFYEGTDGQQHGFDANLGNAMKGFLTGNPIADPTIPNVAGEPGATFVFSQILGVNDNGIAAGYYGDSTMSQHGFFYNTNTGQYTYLDDPAEQFNNGVEVTQITGISNSGEISGFYSDANGVFNGFVACPVGEVCSNTGVSAAPEPASVVLGSCGLAVLSFICFRRRRNAA